MIYAPAISVGVQFVLGYQNFLAGFFQHDMSVERAGSFTFGIDEVVCPRAFYNQLEAAGTTM